MFVNTSGLIYLFVAVAVAVVDSDYSFSCPELGSNVLLAISHSTPSGNVSAGHFIKVNVAKSLLDCVLACCADDTCNVAFFFNISCYSVRCQNVDACKPLKRSGKKFENSFVVAVRNVDESLIWNDLKEEKLPFPEDFYQNFHGDPREKAPEPYLLSRKISNNLLGSTSSDSNIFDTTLHDLKVFPHACVYGIGPKCPSHETCVPKNNRARSGVCRCVDGYERDLSGACKKRATSAEELITLSSFAVDQINENATSVDAISLQQLVVSAGDNVTLHLPENEITLSAYALKQQGGESDSYKYEWTLISHPEGDETGTMQDQNTKNLKLSKLRAGLYTFKVTVSTDNAVGEATVNVTVLPPERENKLPIAVIQPSNVTIKLPNKDTVLDGSFSTDDDKIVKFQWEVLQEPIGYSLQLNETPTLQLKNLIPGLYRFKLTITDSKGASNFTFANVTVQKETDYPPTANAKSEVVIYLPQNEVTLNGNLSTDDKGIKSWEWKKSPDTDKAVDMEGTNGPYLHLSQLEVGVYKFILKVTDTADQTSTTEVHLFVKPESNTPPVANAGTDQKITLPLQGPVILNGTASKDDIKIVKWTWQQIQGPKSIALTNADAAIAKMTSLVPGHYRFMLTVYDDKHSHSSAYVNITVIQTENLPPRANAGGDKTLYLPCNVVVMNGSQSSDDAAIVRYEWTRDPASLAAGAILENSDKSPVLKLTGLMTGRYLFRLTVFDTQGASSSDTASLIIKSPVDIMNEVEMRVNADIKSFTQEQLDTHMHQLEILLHEGEPIQVNLIELGSDLHTRRVVLRFTVERTSRLNGGLVSGTDVVSRLKQKLRTDRSLLDVEVLSVDTVVCQNNCSGHGICDQYTKHCVCEAFWMQDIFRFHLGDKESNCDWSILYVIIVSFLLIILFAGVLWCIACCCTRLKFQRPKKRHRYTLLDDVNDREREREKFIPKTQRKVQKSSLMMSESESDAIFESPIAMTSHGSANGVAGVTA